MIEMKWTLAYVALTLLLVWARSANAAEEAEIYHTPEEKRAAGQGTVLGDAIEFGALFEIEGAAERAGRSSGGKETISDVSLATIQLGWDAKIDERFFGTLVLLWEEDSGQEISVDEGAARYKGNGFEVTAGRFYVPFGVFHSHFISDPLTLELGEMQESGVAVRIAPSDFVQISLTAANGEVDKAAARDRVDDFGLNLDLHPSIGKNATLDFGVGYYSDLSDADAGLLGGRAYEKRVGGLAAHAGWSVGPANLSVEWLGSAESFSPADLDANGDGIGDRPAAWNFEAAHVLDDGWEVALKYEGSEEYAEFPNTRYGVAASKGLEEGVSLHAEWLREMFSNDFSPDRSYCNRITTQLAVEF